ncbi:hypothetical protein J6590_059906 [Homalodisca vitripennis]|nr:hypothetical protein J6590_059906 [Homalodisca vitripennis]
MAAVHVTRIKPSSHGDLPLRYLPVFALAKSNIDCATLPTLFSRPQNRNGTVLQTEAGIEVTSLSIGCNILGLQPCSMSTLMSSSIYVYCFFWRKSPESGALRGDAEEAAVDEICKRRVMWRVSQKSNQPGWTGQRNLVNLTFLIRVEYSREVFTIESGSVSNQPE